MDFMSKKGFTLAEILITLSIIGVVAALTIVSAIKDYQKISLYSRFNKVYNTLQTAFQLAYAQKGSIKSWVGTYTKDDVFFDVYYKEYLDILRPCSDEPSDCNYKKKYLNYKDTQESSGQTTVHPGYILKDGSIITLDQDNIGHNKFYVDTNGKKGPNTWGRDIFMFFYSEEYTGKPLIYPYGSFTRDYLGNPIPRPLKDFEKPQDAIENNCSTKVSSRGTGCGARLLIEGKMNY